MSARTPGPWEVANWRETDKEDRLIATVAIVGYCVVGPKFDAPHNTNYENHGSDVADARLISAAPDMLAALRMMRDPGRNEDSQWYIEAIRAADAAIAKATGAAQ